MGNRLHPALKRQVLGMRITQGLFLLLGILFAWGLGVKSMGLAAIAVIAATLWAGWVLGRRRTAVLFRTDWLLRRGSAMPVRMTGTGVCALEDHLVRVQVAGDEPCRPSCLFAQVKAPGRGMPPLEAIEGTLYAGTLRDNSELVIQCGEYLYRGRQVSLPQGLARLGRFKRWETAISIVLITVIAGFAVKGVFGIDRRQEQARLARLSESWPTVEATIAGGFIEEVKLGGTHGGRTGYRPRLSFAYAVAGRSYTGDILHFCAGGYRKIKNARAVLGRPPVAARVTAHYDAQNPARAVLEVGHRPACDKAVQRARNTTIIAVLLALFLAFRTAGRRRRFQQAVAGVRDAAASSSNMAKAG